MDPAEKSKLNHDFVNAIAIINMLTQAVAQQTTEKTVTESMAMIREQTQKIEGLFKKMYDYV